MIRTSWRQGGLCAVGIAVALLFVVGCGSDGSDSDQPAAEQLPAEVPTAHPDSEQSSNENETSQATEIAVVAADAEVYQQVLDKHRGKVVLVDYWALWCIPCIQRFPHTVKMQQEHGNEGLAVVSMSFDDPEREGDVLEFLKKNNASFDNLICQVAEDKDCFEVFNVDGGALPHFKVYDKTGKLRHTFATDPLAERQFTSSDIEEKVKELLAE